MANIGLFVCIGLIGLLECVWATNNGTSVFSSNNSFLDLSNTLSLESFIHWNSNDEPNSNIKILKIALNIHLLANSSGADNQDYYHMASSRLKRLLPKLERIELNGGHCFYPENGNNAQLKSEFRFLSHSVESIWKAFRYVDVIVRPLTYKLVLVFNKEALESTNIEETLRKLFGQESAVHSSSNQTHFTLINDAHNNHLDIRLDILTDLEAIRENTGLTAGRTNFTIAERELYKVPGSGFNEKIFTSGKKLVYRTIYSPLYLEDLIEKVNIKKQLELEKLTFNLLIYPLSNETLEAMKEKYNKAVGNLHKSAPNLKHIDIMGGHSLMRQNGTSNEVESELNLLKNGLDAVVQAFAEHNLTLHSVIMQIFMVFPEEAFSSMNYSGKVDELFNNNQFTNITSFPNLTLIDQKLQRNVEIRLELSTATDFQIVRSMTKLEDGYSEDFTGASLFSNLFRGDLHVHDW